MNLVKLIAEAVTIAGNSGASLPYEITYRDVDGSQKALLVTEQNGYLEHAYFEQESADMPWLKFDLPAHLAVRLVPPTGEPVEIPIQ